MKKMKILVIGASGLLAGPVIRKLHEKEFDLRLFSRSINPSMFKDEYEMVQGDLFNCSQLEKAMDGCDAVHISISTSDDVKATEQILGMARKKNIRLVSMVSGCTVREENRWFKFIDDKLKCEKLLIESGIPYFIFRPTWFFESLEMFVRDGKAAIPGRQTGHFHFVSADDFGTMVAEAFSKPEAENKVYYVYGPEKYTIKELLEKYCRTFYPEIRSVSAVPIPMLRIMAFLTGNRNLKFAASLFGYFEKVSEPEIPVEKLQLLVKAETRFDDWACQKS